MSLMSRLVTVSAIEECFCTKLGIIAALEHVLSCNKTVILTFPAAAPLITMSCGVG